MKSKIKLINTTLWKRACININDLPLEENVMKNVSRIYENINNNIILLQSLVRGFIVRKKKTKNRGILFLLPDGRYIY